MYRYNPDVADMYEAAWLYWMGDKQEAFREMIEVVKRVVKEDCVENKEGVVA